MNELIEKALEEYFSDFKKYHLIILICFALIIALLQIIQSIYVSQKIERFKNVLKKSEIKFSKYNELQIEALGEIYPLLAVLLVSTSMVQQELGSASPERIKASAEDWAEAFNNIFKNFLEKKYILTIEMQDNYFSLINKLAILNQYIKTEKDLSSLFATLNNGEIEFMGNEYERIELYDKLDKFNPNTLLDETIELTKKLRSSIDEYFIKIE